MTWTIEKSDQAEEDLDGLSDADFIVADDAVIGFANNGHPDIKITHWGDSVIESGRVTVWVDVDHRRKWIGILAVWIDDTMPISGRPEPLLPTGEPWTDDE